MSERTLLGAWISPYFSLAAQILRESELDFAYVRVSPFTGESRGASHLAHNPLGKVPALIDGTDATVSESLAIGRYLARAYPSARGFYPSDSAAACARIDTLCDYINFSIGGPFFTWFVVGAHFPIAWRFGTPRESAIFSQWAGMLVNGELGRLLDACQPSPCLLGDAPVLADFQLFYILEHGRAMARLVGDPSFDLAARDERLDAFYAHIAAPPATQWVLGQRETEFEESRREYFEEMEPGFRAMIEGTRPFLEMMFGHPV